MKTDKGDVTGLKIVIKIPVTKREGEKGRKKKKAVMYWKRKPAGIPLSAWLKMHKKLPTRKRRS